MSDMAPLGNVDANDVIDDLVARVASLTRENAMLAAALRMTQRSTVVSQPQEVDHGTQGSELQRQGQATGG